jgi:NADH:ubiquinone oxidoreductase subunit 5 (subunit L)/multisubunit Na+/H+ antiporter MnhA subunit
LTGGLACACFGKVIGCVFLGLPRTEIAGHARECGWFMRAPMAALAGLCVLLGLAPIVGAPALDLAAAEWAGGGRGEALPELRSLVPFGTMGIVLTALLAIAAAAALVGGARFRARTGPRAGTWDCGYALPTARMQYTASSFARSLVRLFAFALRPREHAPAVSGPFPRSASYEGHVDDAVLQRIVAPFCRAVAARFVRLRQRQTGRIQVYILWVVLTMLCLLLLVIPLLQLLRRLVTQ